MMLVVESFIVFSSLLVVPMVTNASPILYSHVMHVTLSRQLCTQSLYENQDTSVDITYSSLERSLQTAIADIYNKVYNSDFYKTSITKFYCERDDVVYVEFNVDLKVADVSKNVSRVLQRVLLQNAVFSSLTTSNDKVVAGALNKENAPSVYTTVETELVNNVLCNENRLETFRRNLANKLIVVDEVSGLHSVQSSQIMFSYHQCGDTASRFKNAKLRVYVAPLGEIVTAEVELTRLAYKVLEQIVYDGSAWKLGMTLDKRISDVTLTGVDDGVDRLSDVEIIYLGFGIVIALLLLIVAVIMILKRCCRCCQGDDNDADDEPEVNRSVLTGDHYYTTATRYESFNMPDTKEVPDDNTGMKNVAYEKGNNVVLEVLPPSPKNDIKPKGILKERNDYGRGNDDTDDDGDDLDYVALSTLKGNRAFIQREYRSIKRMMPAGDSYTDKARQKNRTTDNYPWPDKRVLLKVVDDDPDTDYINASYVKGFDGTDAFISAQAPLSTTIKDFWRMIWENGVELVVMASSVTSHGQEKCAPYWPIDSVVRVHGKFTIKLKDKELKPDYVITRVMISHGVVSRDVLIYRYMSWPTQGQIPDSLKSVISFLLEVKEKVEESKSLSIFHGSNATDMGAVFLVIVQAFVRYEAQRHVNIKKMVRLLRQDQAGAVENFEQYKFIYDAVLLFANYLEK